MGDGIVEKQFVKITHAKEQQTIGVGGLGFVPLGKHRGRACNHVWGFRSGTCLVQSLPIDRRGIGTRF